MVHFCRSAVIALVTAVLLPAGFAWSGTVDFEGYVYGPHGSPVVNGFAIAGTFASDFDPHNYSCHYGVDEACNMEGSRYSEAVNDGNFIPIGSGELTDGNGYFHGSDATDETGMQIYFFVFDDPDPDRAANVGLATGPGSSFVVPDDPGLTSVHTSNTDEFIFGYKFADGIQVNILPFPEPSTVALALLAGCGLIFGRRRSLIRRVSS